MTQVSVTLLEVDHVVVIFKDPKGEKRFSGFEFIGIAVVIETSPLILVALALDEKAVVLPEIIRYKAGICSEFIWGSSNCRHLWAEVR